MKRPRITIGMVMLGVLILAANFALFRRAFAAPFESATFRVVVSAPVTSLLLFAFVIVCYDLRRHAEARPFLAAFCFVGAFVVVAFDWVWSENSSILRYVQWVYSPLSQAFPRWVDSVSMAVQIAMAAVALAVPQVFLAALGGWAASRIGLRLVILPRPARVPDLPDVVANVVN